MASEISRVKAPKLVGRDFAVQVTISNVLENNRLIAEVGSVDAFLEALEIARVAHVQVMHNDGRPGGACVGDLVTREVQKMVSSA